MNMEGASVSGWWHGDDAVKRLSETTMFADIVNLLIIFHKSGHIHGDAHIQNVVVAGEDPQKFILVDFERSVSLQNLQPAVSCTLRLLDTMHLLKGFFHVTWPKLEHKGWKWHSQAFEMFSQNTMQFLDEDVLPGPLKEDFRKFLLGVSTLSGGRKQGGDFDEGGAFNAHEYTVKVKFRAQMFEHIIAAKCFQFEDKMLHFLDVICSVKKWELKNIQKIEIKNYVSFIK
jgi:hypothetical protein